MGDSLIEKRQIKIARYISRIHASPSICSMIQMEFSGLGLMTPFFSATDGLTFGLSGGLCQYVTSTHIGGVGRISAPISDSPDLPAGPVVE